MGEIAEMMLDGTLCEGCGVYLPGDGIGVPRRCRDCAKEAREQPKLTTPRKKVKQLSSKADLPKWATEASDDIVPRFHCAHCIKHFATDAAARDHVRDNHA